MLVLVGCLILIGNDEASGELLMQTQGYASFAPYIHGVEKTAGLYPGYRAEFLSHVDFFRKGRFVASGIVGNMTIISRSDSTVFNLDKIRYTLSPGIRYEFDTWFIQSVFHHESLYSISRAEDFNGAYWQNSIRFGIGTKSSSYLYLPEKFTSGAGIRGSSFDARCTAGMFMHGSDSVWSARNHSYRYEMLSVLRYHVSAIHNWIISSTLNQHLWLKEDNSSENKTSLTINFYKKATGRLFGIYYVYTLYDSYEENNEDKQGALGLRIVY